MIDFSFVTMFKEATLVAQLVLLLLAFLSVISWSLMIYKFFSLNAALRLAQGGILRFTDARDLREAVRILALDVSSPLYRVAQQGVAEFNRSKDAGNAPEVVAGNVRRALDQGVNEAMGTLSSSLPFLATTANTAPFIGLFGTVWGIMYSFHKISQMKTAAISTVAPGISEALVATAVGLFVAIPATVGYNTFLGTTSRIQSELANFAGVFLNRVQRELHETHAGSDADA